MSWISYTRWTQESWVGLFFFVLQLHMHVLLKASEIKIKRWYIISQSVQVHVGAKALHSFMSIIEDLFQRPTNLPLAQHQSLFSVFSVGYHQLRHLSSLQVLEQPTDQPTMCTKSQNVWLLVPVVQRMDNAIHWRNLYLVDRAVCFVNNGNRTEWSLIQSVIIPVNNKLKQLPSGSPIC